MAIYRNVQMTFWTDPKVKKFTPEEKYFYLYLMTNIHTNLCGCYEVDKGDIAYETGYNTETVQKLIHRLEEQKVIVYSDTEEMLLVNWHKYNWTKSDKFRKPLAEEINAVKDSNFKKYLIDLYNEEDTVSIPYRYRIDTVSAGDGYPIDTNCIDTTVTVPVTDTVSVNKNKRTFKKPIIEELKAYIQENSYCVDPERFMAYYDSNGWKVGKNPMKDWKAAVRSWHQREAVKTEQVIRPEDDIYR